MDLEEFPVHGGQPRQRSFVIVDHDDGSVVIDRLTEHEWAPAIIAYAERLARGAYSRRVSLRETRSSDRLPGPGGAAIDPSGRSEGHAHLNIDQITSA